MQPMQGGGSGENLFFLSNVANVIWVKSFTSRPILRAKWYFDCRYGKMIMITTTTTNTTTTTTTTTRTTNTYNNTTTMLNNNMENSPRNVESSEQKVSPSHTTDRTKKLICDDPIPGSG